MMLSARLSPASLPARSGLSRLAQHRPVAKPFPSGKKSQRLDTFARVTPASSNSDEPELTLPVEKFDEDEAELRAWLARKGQFSSFAKARGTSGGFQPPTASKIKNRSGRSVIVVQHKRKFKLPEVRTLKLNLGGSATSASGGFEADWAPSEAPDEYHYMLLADDGNVWLTSGNGKEVTVFPNNQSDQYYVVNQPLPGLWGRITIQGETFAAGQLLRGAV